MSAGSGTTLGAALADLFATGGRPGGQRSTFNRVSWKAQFAQMTRTRTGYAAMEAAGLTASVRTQRGWLSGDSVPTAANQARINEAYRTLRGGFGSRWASADYAIKGRLTQGSDSRERGRGGKNPLRLEGRLGRWDRIADEWDGDADPATLEALFIEDMMDPNIGEPSTPWDFDGNWYEVNA